jgi:hypothetical protein
LNHEPGVDLLSSALDYSLFVRLLLDLRLRFDSRTKLGGPGYSSSRSSITFSMPLTTRVKRS